MLPALNDEGIHSEILTTQGPRTGQPEAIDGVNLTAYTTSVPAFLWTGFSFKLARSIQSTVRQFDAVHIHELWHYPHFAAARAAITAEVPYLITPHGALEPWAVDHKGLKKHIYMSAVQRRYLNRASTVQALTNAEASQVSAIAPAASPTVIPNGLDLRATDSGSWQQLSSAVQEFLTSHRVITFMGRLHQKKGIEPLVEGFLKISKDIPDIALLFVGPDEGEFTSSIKSQAGESGVAKRVMVAGAINGDERFEILRRSSAFALTSYSEGFSMAVLEALASRIPVIISPACYFPEAIDAGAGILTEPEPESIANALTEVLSSDAKRELMGDAGRNLIESRYTISNVARQLANTYRTLG
jgi:glycosyltransferase involved in cell wall biosynthesis